MESSTLPIWPNTGNTSYKKTSGQVQRLQVWVLGQAQMCPLYAVGHMGNFCWLFYKYHESGISFHLKKKMLPTIVGN